MLLSQILSFSKTFLPIVFNSSTTHSFVNPKFANKLGYRPDEMDIQLCMTTPSSSICHINVILKNYLVHVNKRILPGNLECDIILRMISQLYVR